VEGIKMITVKQAVNKALEFVQEIIPKEELISPRLEEVELSSDEHVWSITISFIWKTDKIPSLAEEIEDRYGSTSGSYSAENREYKLISIDAETGKPLSMKIRQLV
jgi:hypothetical protein